MVKDRFVNLDELSLEKNMISNVPLKYGKKIVAKELKEKIICKFSTKNIDLQHQEIINPTFFKESQKRNYKIAFLKPYPNPITKKPIIFLKTSKKEEENKNNHNYNLKTKHNEMKKNNTNALLILQEENEDVLYMMKISFREKVSVTFRGRRIMNLSIEGKIILSGIIPHQEMFLKLNDFWKNSQKITSTITPNKNFNMMKISDDTYKYFMIQNYNKINKLILK